MDGVMAFNAQAKQMELEAKSIHVKITLEKVKLAKEWAQLEAESLWAVVSRL
jgi:hypothetical protein